MLLGNRAVIFVCQSFLENKKSINFFSKHFKPNDQLFDQQKQSYNLKKNWFWEKIGLRNKTIYRNFLNFITNIHMSFLMNYKFYCLHQTQSFFGLKKVKAKYFIEKHIFLSQKTKSKNFFIDSIILNNKPKILNLLSANSDTLQKDSGKKKIFLINKHFHYPYYDSINESLNWYYLKINDFLKITTTHWVLSNQKNTLLDNQLHKKNQLSEQLCKYDEKSFLVVYSKIKYLETIKSAVACLCWKTFWKLCYYASKIAIIEKNKKISQVWIKKKAIQIYFSVLEQHWFVRKQTKKIINNVFLKLKKKKKNQTFKYMFQMTQNKQIKILYKKDFLFFHCLKINQNNGLTLDEQKQNKKTTSSFIDFLNLPVNQTIDHLQNQNNFILTNFNFLKFQKQWQKQKQKLQKKLQHIVHKLILKQKVLPLQQKKIFSVFDFIFLSQKSKISTPKFIDKNKQWLFFIQKQLLNVQQKIVLISVFFSYIEKSFFLYRKPSFLCLTQKTIPYCFPYIITNFLKQKHLRIEKMDYGLFLFLSHFNNVQKVQKSKKQFNQQIGSINAKSLIMAASSIDFLFGILKKNRFALANLQTMSFFPKSNSLIQGFDNEKFLIQEQFFALHEFFFEQNAWIATNKSLIFQQKKLYNAMKFIHMNVSLCKALSHNYLFGIANMSNENITNQAYKSKAQNKEDKQKATKIKNKKGLIKQKVKMKFTLMLKSIMSLFFQLFQQYMNVLKDHPKSCNFLFFNNDKSPHFLSLISQRVLTAIFKQIPQLSYLLTKILMNSVLSWKMNQNLMKLNFQKYQLIQNSLILQFFYKNQKTKQQKKKNLQTFMTQLKKKYKKNNTFLTELLLKKQNNFNQASVNFENILQQKPSFDHISESQGQKKLISIKHKLLRFSSLIANLHEFLVLRKMYYTKKILINKFLFFSFLNCQPFHFQLKMNSNFCATQKSLKNLIVIQFNSLLRFNYFISHLEKYSCNKILLIMQFIQQKYMLNKQLVYISGISMIEKKIKKESKINYQLFFDDFSKKQTKLEKKNNQKNGLANKLVDFFLHTNKINIIQPFHIAFGLGCSVFSKTQTSEFFHKVFNLKHPTKTNLLKSNAAFSCFVSFDAFACFAFDHALAKVHTKEKVHANSKTGTSANLNVLLKFFNLFLKSKKAYKNDLVFCLVADTYHSQNALLSWLGKCIKKYFFFSHFFLDAPFHFSTIPEIDPVNYANVIKMRKQRYLNLMTYCCDYIYSVQVTTESKLNQKIIKQPEKSKKIHFFTTTFAVQSTLDRDETFAHLFFDQSRAKIASKARLATEAKQTKEARQTKQANKVSQTSTKLELQKLKSTFRFFNFLALFMKKKNFIKKIKKFDLITNLLKIKNNGWVMQVLCTKMTYQLMQQLCFINHHKKIMQLFHFFKKSKTEKISHPDHIDLNNDQSHYYVKMNHLSGISSDLGYDYLKNKKLCSCFFNQHSINAIQKEKYVIKILSTYKPFKKPVVVLKFCNKQDFYFYLKKQYFFSGHCQKIKFVFQNWLQKHLNLFFCFNLRCYLKTVNKKFDFKNITKSQSTQKKQCIVFLMPVRVKHLTNIKKIFFFQQKMVVDKEVLQFKKVLLSHYLKQEKTIFLFPLLYKFTQCMFLYQLTKQSKQKLQIHCKTVVLHFLNKTELCRFQNKAFNQQKKKGLINNIYCLSHRFSWNLDNELHFFLSYLWAPDDLPDRTIKIYDNRIITSKHSTEKSISEQTSFIGAGIVRSLLSELNSNEFRKIYQQLQLQIHSLKKQITECQNFFEKNDQMINQQKKQIKTKYKALREKQTNLLGRRFYLRTMLAQTFVQKDSKWEFFSSFHLVTKNLNTNAFILPKITQIPTKQTKSMNLFAEQQNKTKKKGLSSTTCINLAIENFFFAHAFQIIQSDTTQKKIDSNTQLNNHSILSSEVCKTVDLHVAPAFSFAKIFYPVSTFNSASFDASASTLASGATLAPSAIFAPFAFATKAKQSKKTMQFMLVKEKASLKVHTKPKNQPNTKKVYKQKINDTQNHFINSLNYLDNHSYTLRDQNKEHDLKKQQKIFQQCQPESMILSNLPVLPPDLRPIIQVQQQITASDLNRLYQKVIYRNDRLKRFLKDPATRNSAEIRFSQRLLQEAVDNLIENGKAGNIPESDNRGRPLKSISDLLKGKKGRFRQNLLGKRVDYSGRSVIVVGPKLSLHQCGLPKEMAVELFMPFLIQKILSLGFAKTILGAKNKLLKDPAFAWQCLRSILPQQAILLNRAPTLHRVSFQAFQPILIDGRAILLHPLVCPAFNADFDGDQMAVHVPITVEAKAEAWKLMMSQNHIISPATGDPLILPSQDMVLGCYYLTSINAHYFSKYKPMFEKDFLFPMHSNLKKNLVWHSDNKEDLKEKAILKNRVFSNVNQVILAYENEQILLQSPIWLKVDNLIQSDQSIEKLLEIQIPLSGQIHEIRSNLSQRFEPKCQINHQFILTTPGRVLFNSFLINIVKEK
jgi:DNA-directed RNA polymerase beta' subunit